MSRHRPHGRSALAAEAPPRAQLIDAKRPRPEERAGMILHKVQRAERDAPVGVALEADVVHLERGRDGLPDHAPAPVTAAELRDAYLRRGTGQRCMHTIIHKVSKMRRIGPEQVMSRRLLDGAHRRGASLDDARREEARGFVISVPRPTARVESGEHRGRGKARRVARRERPVHAREHRPNRARALLEITRHSAHHVSRGRLHDRIPSRAVGELDVRALRRGLRAHDATIPSGARALDAPGFTDILGAAKLVGHTTNGWTAVIP